MQELHAAQTAGVKKFEHGPIPDAQRHFYFGLTQNTFSFIFVQHAGMRILPVY